MKNQGVEEDRLQLLCDVSSAFRPGVLTALVGMFVEEVMELVELDSLRDALVGLPGADGLSTEQRKRLTIAVELVANPSIIFMDEPTSGLDARAAAIVTRTVRNTVDTGRTVVCTIHQPSIDIFEAFDELLLMKMGGQVTYTGPLGRHSHKLIEYFEAIPGVPKIAESVNPAIWMLEISTSQAEANLNIDFADIYANSTLYHNAINVQPVVAVERTVFYRERAAGMYSAMAYAFAQASQLSYLYQRDLNRYKRRELVGMVVSIEVSYILVQGFVYTILLFSMIGFTWRGDNFFWFFYFIVMSFTYFALLPDCTTGMRLHILDAWFLEKLLIYNADICIGLLMAKFAAYSHMVEVVLLGNSSILDNLRCHRVAAGEKRGHCSDSWRTRQITNRKLDHSYLYEHRT
ncbi:hypothetical protein ZIOFF_012141 [Zingiber officinale]|uniref:ABC transporter family G domain-containing protein n=1 Tax=Zingiber officinale TaxID=94328 RepID=A0A8J5M2L3_ZINOF|nr:hypothetical protein ZIOFF_012141 [Zingiber officinale]